MVSKAQQVRDFINNDLVSYGCLNGYEACRLINGFPKRDFKACFENRDRTRCACNRDKRGCQIDRSIVYDQLMLTVSQGNLQSEKMRFWDGGQKSCRITDLFRFFFVDRQAFEQRVLRQTLIPYVTKED